MNTPALKRPRLAPCTDHGGRVLCSRTQQHTRTQSCLQCRRQAAGRGQRRLVHREQSEHTRLQAVRDKDLRGQPAGPPQITEQKERQRDVAVQAALSVLWLYKNAVSPLLPKSCRFIPTCSGYAVEAYEDFGFCKGSALTVWRILRCNPLSRGGFDPPAWPPVGLERLFGQAPAAK